MKNNASQTIVGLLFVLVFIFGMIVGGLVVYFVLVGSVERVINDMQGLFVNNQLTVNINETKLIEEFNRTILPQIR
jgi:hypothetical protein